MICGLKHLMQKLVKSDRTDDPELTPLERSVLGMIFDGDHPVLAALRAQLQTARVVGREFTGVGFFLSVEVDPRVRAPARSLRFGDVVADIVGLRHGAGFLVFVDDGLLDTLEAYTFEEPWPSRASEYTLKYVASENAHCDGRDWPALVRELDAAMNRP